MSVCGVEALVSSVERRQQGTYEEDGGKQKNKIDCKDNPRPPGQSRVHARLDSPLKDGRTQVVQHLDDLFRYLR